MRSKIGFSILLLLAVVLAGCGFSPIQVTPNDPGLATALEAYTETAEAIITPTRTPTLKRTLTRTPTVKATITPTATASHTATPTATPSLAPVPKLNALIMTCDTGIDIFNKLGEVTNAYVTVQNVGTGDASDVEVVLSAVDEGKPHPDKSYLVQHLPFGYEISLKLTVDTTEGSLTSLTLNVTSAEGLKVAAKKSGCPSLVPEKDIIQKLGTLFVVRKIVTP